MLELPDFEKKQIVLVFLSRGEKVSFKNDNLIIKDKQGKIKYQSSCYRLFVLCVVGHITVTSGLLQRSEKFKFSIVFMSHNLRVYGVWTSETKGNVIRRSHRELYVIKYTIKYRF